MGNKRYIKRDNSLIFVFSILALFIVALVGFNLESITSGTIKNTRTTTTVEVFPKFLNAGQYVTLNVNPGVGCVNSVIGFYDDSGLRRATARTEVGSPKKVCQPFAVRYKTSPTWKPNEDESGVFFAKVFDYNKEDYITTAFTING
ncbi:hypothetical protein J4443_02770 [Candidatus Woesearchaeota archaeon]|nr:hypothetical protein [Candidatus Woesearchaeota archaeon]